MVDWSRHNEPTARGRNQFLWDLMLLSLLYDDVLVQDEIIVCSERLPRWFPDTESFRLFEETIESGAFKLLKRPQERYPKALQELAERQPITARRRHLEDYSVDNDGNPLIFKKHHYDFHNRLEAFLSKRPSAHRFAGSQKTIPGNLMHEFGQLLSQALTDAAYEKGDGTT